MYNSNKDDVRKVKILLKRNSGGELLGADLACGILHRIPHHLRRSNGKNRDVKGGGLGADDSIFKSVRTPEGNGQIIEKLIEEDGEEEDKKVSYIVKLDWNNEHLLVTGKFVARNVEFVH